MRISGKESSALYNISLRVKRLVFENETGEKENENELRLRPLRMPIGKGGMRCALEAQITHTQLVH